MNEKDLLNLTLAKDAIEEYLLLVEKIKEVLRKNDGKVWARKVPDMIQAVSPFLHVYTETIKNYDGSKQKCIHVAFSTSRYFQKIKPDAPYLPYVPSLTYLCCRGKEGDAGMSYLKDEKYICAEALLREIDRNVKPWRKRLEEITEEASNPDGVTAVVQKYIDTLHNAEEIWGTLSVASQTIFAHGHGTELFNFPYLHK